MRGVYVQPSVMRIFYYRSLNLVGVWIWSTTVSTLRAILLYSCVRQQEGLWLGGFRFSWINKCSAECWNLEVASWGLRKTFLYREILTTAAWILLGFRILEQDSVCFVSNICLHLCLVAWALGFRVLGFPGSINVQSNIEILESCLLCKLLGVYIKPEKMLLTAAWSFVGVSDMEQSSVFFVSNFSLLAEGSRILGFRVLGSLGSVNVQCLVSGFFVSGAHRVQYVSFQEFDRKFLASATL